MMEIKLPNSQQIEDLKDAVTAKRPSANPKAPLNIVKIVNTATYGTPSRPSSIGLDGNVYGADGLRRIHRTVDSYETIEYGVKMTDVTGWDVNQTIARVIQTYAGYVVVGMDATNGVGSIWFSESFESGFTKVIDLDRGYPASLATSIYNQGEKQTVLLIGEYAGGASGEGEERRLFGSFDGGRTFKAILQTPPTVNPNQNQHIHGSTYDPYDGRIYASIGDGLNATTNYSDDLGKTWYTISADYKGQNQQPTLMMSFPDKIATGPDTQTPPAVLSYYKDRKFDLPYTEKFRYEFDYAIYSNSASTAALTYSYRPIAQKGIEAYFTVPRTRQTPLIVVGTGDGGHSWHNVFTMHLPVGNAQEGIVGPDKNGLMYSFFVDTEPKILVLEPAEWLYT